MIKNQWYLACFLHELEKTNLLKKTIVKQDFIIFKNTKNNISILEDRCCHRNVHLSLGKVCNENIKCGYHGWEFNTEGKCVHIPIIENNENIPQKAQVKKYPHKIKHQAVWVYIGENNKIDNASIPNFEAMDHYPFVYNYHTLKANIKLVAESLFDAQHINHVHSKSINTLLGKLKEPKTQYIIETKGSELHGSYHRINNSSIFEKIYFGWNKLIDTNFSFWYPHSSMLSSNFPKHLHFPARKLIIYEHFYQIDDENVMMIQITAWKNIFRFNPWFAKWFMKRKSDKIVNEDIAFLESNKKWHQQLDLNDLILKNDEPTISFMKLWNKNFNVSNEKMD